ncbi:MAG: hypothetical protein AAFZ65_05795 [Planctomycetota bacterium]
MLRHPSTLITAGLAAGVLALAWGGPPGLLAFAAPTAESATIAEAPVAEATVADDWAPLSTEWDVALADWTAKYDAARDLQQRRSLRENHPALAFWDRFDALSRTEGRAAVWMVEFAGRAGHRGAKGLEVKAEAYARAFASPGALDADWMEPFLSTLAKDRRSVGDEGFAGYLTRVAEGSKVDNNRARAMFVHGQWLAKSDDDERHAKGLVLLERAAALDGTPAAGEAAAALYELKNLAIGAVAPDFESVTAAGDAFKLSDHRGKIVVLDFFGFW